MSDLTERLRALGMPGSVHRITADEAADRIEELEAEVKEWIVNHNNQLHLKHVAEKKWRKAEGYE